MPDATARLAEALADRYRIEREIGAGGMATVYLAEDVRHHRKVALKVLRPELAATLGSDRFFREIEVAAQLQHPHILPLLDSGEIDGFYFYVMPYIAGESLRERLVREGELPVHETVKILAEVVDALAAAHAMGVVHRDIKPDNVMISGRHALVMDFGVAKAVSEATGRHTLTSVGVALGTPAYMAPEQASADPHLDQRVDIYAVGVMGYELLTGRPPFTGRTSQEVLAAHVTRTPEPITALRPAVPPVLAAVIMRCLEKRAADRFQSAEDLLAQLEPLATPSGGMTPTQTRPVEAVTHARRSRSAAAVVVVGSIAVLGLAALLVARRAEEHAPATLRDRTQLTSSGRVSYPAISPDGKQLAYVTTDCSSACTYGIELMDVGGNTTRRLMDGATALYGILWSPDRRNLLALGTVGGRYGSFLVSTLGGGPRLVDAGGRAVFWAGGDSLLLSAAAGADTVFWIRVAGLDGVSRDSVRVAGPAEAVVPLGAVPGAPWIVVAVGYQLDIEWRVIDRRGREGGRLMWRTIGGIADLSADAGWGLPRQAGADPRPPIIRVPFDPRTGRYASRMDTVYTGRVTQFSVTADGGTLVLDEGISDYGAWALDLRDALSGDFPDDRRLLRSTTLAGATITPDGSRVVTLRTEATTAGGGQLNVAPFGGGAATPIPVSGSLIDFAWGADSLAVALAENTEVGVQFTLADLRTGARKTPFAIADSAIHDMDALPGEGWVWIPLDGRSVRVVHRVDMPLQSFSIPDWYVGVGGFRVDAAPAGDRVAFLGFNAATYDSLRLSVMSLADGEVTPWVTYFAEKGDVQWLPDGSILLRIWEAQETVTLYRVRGPGQVERLGTIPRPVFSISVSEDLRRATVGTREYKGDAWMYKVTLR